MATENVCHSVKGIDLSEPVDLDIDLDYDSFDEGGSERPAERWAPLGAAVSPTPSPHEPYHCSQSDELTRLEEEQEQLNSSLLALTTHFAQVQFRLKQIVCAKPEDKESLLKELEEFAFKGIPDVRGCHTQDAQLLEEMSEKEHEVKITAQREKQRELIHQLKSQLEDLENYAYETGDADSLPTSKVMEKQKVVLEELRHKLDLNLENFNSLSAEELRQVVDHAVGQIVNPAKVKEKLVDQLKTQIVDLERFILFLQGEATSPGQLGTEHCLCPMHESEQIPKGASGLRQKGISSSKQQKSKTQTSYSSSEKRQDKGNHKHLNDSATSIMQKVLTIMQIYVISQVGCGSRDFKRNLLKKTARGNHWGDLRAKLEMAVTKCIELAQQQQKQATKHDTDSEDYSSDTEKSALRSSAALTQCVRKDLAMAVRDLMEHGLMEVGQSSSLTPFGCFPSRSAQVTRMLHAWDLFLKYYEMKHGREYNESPARKLSQSFHLEMVGGKPITARQTLLGAIDSVIKSHAPLKRSEDAQLKAFICMALNERKLVTWLRLLFRTQILIDAYYQDWSYVARTGFEDALQSLEKLLVINFNLPVDLAVRPFSNIRDAF